jgi:ankyrin repeat protein
MLLLHSTNELGVTPLVYYLRSRNYEHVRFLLACGAHVFAPWESALFTTKWEQDPRILHMAMDVRVPDDLFRSLVKSVPPKQISQAVALLHNATSSGRRDYCDILITAGASVNNCMVYGNNSISPLHDVVLVDARGCGIDFFKDEGERYEKVRHLIKSLVAAGADINIIGFDVQLNMDVSPLHLTSFLGCTYSAKFLLDHGADINLLNNHKKSPLHITASKYPRPYFTGTLQLLLERGARLDLRDNTDHTAEELARARERHDIADMIAAESLAHTKWSDPRNAWIGVVVRATHRRHGSR